SGALSTRYAWTLRRVLHHRAVAAVAVGALVVLGALVATRIPSGFLPEMDEGAFVLDYFLPAGTSLEATNAAALRIEAILGQTPHRKLDPPDGSRARASHGHPAQPGRHRRPPGAAGGPCRRRGRHRRSELAGG